MFAECSVPMGEEVDASFKAFWASSRANVEGTFTAEAESSQSFPTSSWSPRNSLNYSPLYASMPLHRTTVLRDPFGWLVSKFFFDGKHRIVLEDGKKLECDDIQEASRASAENPGWAYQAVLHYLMFLCGEDCPIRYEKNEMSFEEIRIQVLSNLKQSFSVVGLFNETDTFYDMVSARIKYVDMRLNPHVTGDAHYSGNSPHRIQCKAVFANTTFQEAFKEALPLLAILEEAWQVGLQVSRSHLSELQACPGFGQLKQQNLGNTTAVGRSFVTKAS